MDSLKKADIEQLLGWYRNNKRDLPWRDTGDIYDVWLSEIMLQQTRVEAVKGYFGRFKKEVPDIRSLSETDDDALLRLWEGLGYYSRARNLKKCAVKLVEEYGGAFPKDEKELMKLPGIGPYTAGAILSIGYGIPHAAVDGNVMRVMARYFGISEDIRSQEVKDRVVTLIDDFYRNHPLSDSESVRDLSQAFMELGAIVCVPNGAPDCEACPWKENCICHRDGSYETIPYRSSLRERKIVKKTLLILRDHDRFLLHKRDSKGLLAGMYEFLSVDEWLDRDEAVSYAKKLGLDVLRISRIEDSRHIFTHLEWHMRAFEMMISEWQETLPEDCILANREELENIAIPSAFRTYIDRYALRERKEE